MNELIRSIVTDHLGRLGGAINKQMKKIAELEHELEHERRLLRRAQEEYASIEDSLAFVADTSQPIHDFVWEDLDERSN